MKRHSPLFLIVAMLLLGTGSTSFGAEETDVVTKLDIAEFKQYFPEFSTVTNADSAPQKKGRKILSPQGSKEILLLEPDYTKIPPEERTADVFVFQEGRPISKLHFHGFRNLDLEWVDEFVLKTQSWPGTRVCITELIEVDSGRVLYQAATGFYQPIK